MTDVAAAPAAPKKRAKRTPSLGVETQSITIDLPKDMYAKFDKLAKEDEMLPLKMFLVRQLAGKNRNQQAPTPLAINE